MSPSDHIHDRCCGYAADEIAMNSRSTIPKFGSIGVLYALEEASRIPNVESQDLKSVFGRENWSASSNPKYDRDEILDAGLISRLSTVAHEIDSMTSILKHLTDTATELGRQYKGILNPVMSKLSKGISSLPDEVLAMVFESAVRAAGQEGVEQAKRLSHVSRRFRAIAISECNLWTNFRSSSSREELETLVSRSGSNTHIHIHIYIPISTSTLPFEDFLKICSPTSFRWNSMMIGDLSYNTNVRFDSTNSATRELERAMDSLMGHVSYFPALRELDIQSLHRHARRIPTPSMTTFIHSRYLSGSYTLFQKMQELLDFLASMTSLAHLELEFGNADNVALMQTLRQPASGLPSVKNFRLRLPNFVIDTQRQYLVGPFLEALQVPNLESFSVVIDFRDQGRTNEHRRQLLETLPQEVLPIQFSNPPSRLSSLTFEVTVTYDDPQKTPETPTVFNILIDRAPSVSTLTVSSRACIVLIRNSYAVIEENRPNEMIPVEMRRRPICLREIRFKDCEDMDIGNLQNAVQFLKKDGYWKALDRVIVSDCKLLEHKGVLLEELGENKIQYI
ncbi:hypothetical protein SCHPADRAFT_944572 [Schizopora paradoxa]|uniref:Uncharacterized protein n=1 Tax=Schizopora paradoxa TaxID=27342 RepID=A0A0H2RFH8_9AGAM|nr:hypothetical protein SCHPADRAFT_944572 [Schizopora paradoxa]